MSIVSNEQAVKLLKAGTPVALPTETVYGLAAPINQPEALKKIFEIKKRPLTDPLIVHVSSIKMAKTLFLEINEDIQHLMKVFWPGPLTLVAPKNETLVSDLITSGFKTVAVRMPESEVFRSIIEQSGVPLAAPSANLFKKVSPTSANHILQTLPGIHVVDGGSCRVGIESTIYDVLNKQILRPGDINHTQIENALSKSVTYTEKDFTPGSEKEHYRPETPVFVFENQEDLYHFMDQNKGSVEVTINPDSKIAAQSFYGDLRLQDQKKASQICIFFDPSWTDAHWNGLKNRLIKTTSKWKKYEK